MKMAVSNTLGELTDEEILKAFQGTNFGRTDYKHLLFTSVLKVSLGYHCGHTITQIMLELKLIKELKKGMVLTPTGQLSCYYYFDMNRAG